MKKNTLKLFVIAFLSFPFTTISQTIPSYVPSFGLIGWWPFNGNANDESINANNGTVVGATLTNDRFGNANSAFSFNGVNNYIYCINPGPTGNPMVTACFWIKTATTSYGNIIGYGSDGNNGNDFRVTINGGHCIDISFDTWNSVLSHPTSFNNSWDFYTVIYDGSLGNNVNVSKIYLNGNLLSSTCYTANISTTNILNTIPITFGRYHGSSQTAFYNGNLDDIGIWNRVLTPTEITSMYQGCQLAITIQPTNQTANINNSAEFVIQSTDSFASYQWQSDIGFGFQDIANSGQYSGATNDTLMISNISQTNNNQLFRCIVNSVLCSSIDTSNVVSLSTVIGIDDISSKNSFSLFPNPVKSEITLNVEESLVGMKYKISDDNYRSLIFGNINKSNSIIDLKELPSGIYFFTIGNENKQTFKIVKSE